MWAREILAGANTKVDMWGPLVSERGVLNSKFSNLHRIAPKITKNMFRKAKNMRIPPL